jgi:hypothetical protein
MPAKRRGQRRDDDEGIEPGLEVDDDQHVDQHDGADQAEQQAVERAFMVCTWPRTIDVRARGKSFCTWGSRFC